VKFVRAAEHRKSLETKFAKVLDPKLHPITIKEQIEWHRPPERSILLVADDVPQFAPKFGAMVGDVIHNLRSALDHLAWRLVKAGAIPRPPKPEQVQFPLARSGAGFRNQLPQRLPGVPSRPHIALIRRFQPYRRGPRGQAMLALRSFSNTDKHRMLIPTVMAVIQSQIELVPTNCEIVEGKILLSRTGALKPGTPIARALVRFRPIGQHKVNVKGKFTAEPTLGRGRSATGLLRHIEAIVFEVLDSFDRLVEGSRYQPTIPGLSVERGPHKDVLRGLI
jgi:hypothetical protein